MENKVRVLIKRFNAWLIRVDAWFRLPSPLSLLISLLAPVLMFVVLAALWVCEPEFVSKLLQMSAGSHRVPYEQWVVLFYGSFCVFVWCVVHWIFDLIKYIISFFRKSSAPADDK